MKMEWNWPMVDEGRVKRAKSVKFSEIDVSGNPHALAVGSGAEDYRVSLTECSCADFSISAAKASPMPCKHMIALAMKAGILNENGMTPAQQKAADISSLRFRIALAYGFYYHFDDPIMSDQEYDQLKESLSALTE